MKHLKRGFAALLLAVMLLPLVCCAETVSGKEPISIVVTIFPEYDFARAIAGDLANIRMLIKPGAESHSYEPTPQDIIAIENCDVFVCVGGENDTWAATILESTENDIKIAKLLEIVKPLDEERSESMAEEAHEHGEEEEEYDEHVWTSPVNTIQIVSALCDMLCEIDPENAKAYTENAKAYIAEIDTLDGEIRSLISGAKRNVLVFGDRFPFLYFAKEYGLAYDAAYPGCSTDAEASASTVASLIKKVEKEDIPTVLYIELSAHRIADTICEATGAKELLLHSCHNVTKEEFDAGETYVSLMRKNLATLREALY